MTRKEIICPEVAEQEFTRFCDRMDLEVKPENFDAAGLKVFNELKGTVLEAIRFGDVEINEKGCPAVRPSSTGITQPIVFQEWSYGAAEEADKYSKEGAFKKNRVMLSQLTGCEPYVFLKLNKRDTYNLTAILGIMQGESRPL